MAEDHPTDRDEANRYQRERDYWMEAAAFWRERGEELAEALTVAADALGSRALELDNHGMDYLGCEDAYTSARSTLARHAVKLIDG